MQKSHLASKTDDLTLKGNNNSCFKECSRQKTFCLCGSRQSNNHHSNDNLEFSEANKIKQDVIKISDIFIQTIQELESITYFFKEFKKEICIENNQNIISEAALSTDSYINSTNKRTMLFQIICKELLALSEYIVKVKDKMTQYKSQKENQVFNLQKMQNFNEQKEQYDRKDLLSQKSQVQLNQRIINLNQLSIYFSQQNKHKEISLQEQGKMVEGQGFCLSEQAIPKSGGKFTFKIIKCGFLNQVYIGIGSKSLIQTSNFDPKLSDVGHGLYVIQQNGYFYSHHNVEQNHQKLSFKFSPSDIITISINKELKIINWTKKQSNETFTTQYNLQEEIYPVVGLRQGSLIRIISEF